MLTLEDGDAPVFLRIARAVADDIRRGRLRAGAALPGTRALAESLGVNRNTAVAAYRELVAEGWARTHPGGGTFVAESVPEPRGRPFARTARPESLARSPNFALNGHGPRLLGGHPFAAPLPPGTLSLAGGVPDARLLPVRLIARALRAALIARGGHYALGYGDARGDPHLRAALADLVRETRGVPARPEEVLVVRGSQMALAMLARAIVAPGEAVAVEALGYPLAWAAFERAGARVVPVPVDACGLDVDALADAGAARTGPGRLRDAPPPVSDHGDAGPGRRSALLDLARRERIAIIEDDYDHELHYEGRPVLPLASADVHGSVVYVGSLSKVLAPGLRLGYVVAPGPLIERLARERAVVDRQGDHIGERAAAELLEDGTIARHVRRVRRIYAERRDRLVDLLTRVLGDRIGVRAPSGGMALWVRVRLPPAKVVRWEQRALERGVAFVAGERLAFDGRPIPFARLGFAPLDEAEVVEAVTRLARAFPR